MNSFDQRLDVSFAAAKRGEDQLKAFVMGKIDDEENDELSFKKKKRGSGASGINPNR
jgi:hypothetical protein